VTEYEELTVYIEVNGDVNAISDQLRAGAANIPGVSAADVQVEDVERNAAEVLQSITLTITAAGGVVGAGSLLLANLTNLLQNIKEVRAAWRDAGDGVVPIAVSGRDAPAGD
jgi:hypothetical protein